MPKQRHSSYSTRACRQVIQGSATSGRPSTQRRTHGSLDARLPVEAGFTSLTETRPLTTDDIPAIVQQVTSAIFSESHPPPVPAAPTNTTSHSNGSEEDSSNPPAAVLTSGDISSIVDQLMQWPANYQPIRPQEVQPADQVTNYT